MWKELKPGVEVTLPASLRGVILVGLEGCRPCDVATYNLSVLLQKYPFIDVSLYKTEKAWWPSGRAHIAGRDAGVFPVIVGTAEGKEAFRSYGAPLDPDPEGYQGIVTLFEKHGAPLGNPIRTEAL